MSYHFVIYYTLSLEREATPYTRGPRGRSRAGAAAEEAAVHMRQQKRQRYSNTPTHMRRCFFNN